MLTVAAVLILGLLAVVACETTRGRFVRLLADQDVLPAHHIAAPDPEESDA